VHRNKDISSIEHCIISLYSLVADASSSSPRFFKFFKTPVLIRLSVLRTGYSNWLPGGNASMGVNFSITYLICPFRSSFLFLRRKLFPDFIRKLFSSTSCIGCLLSFVTLVLSQSTCTYLLIAGVAIPARTYTSLTLEFLRQPVTNQRGGNTTEDYRKDCILFIVMSVCS